MKSLVVVLLLMLFGASAVEVAAAGKHAVDISAGQLVKKYAEAFSSTTKPVITDITPEKLATELQLSVFSINRQVVIVRGGKLYPVYSVYSFGALSSKTPLKFHWTLEDLDGDGSKELYYMWHRRRGEYLMGGCMSPGGKFTCFSLSGPGSGMNFYRDDAGKLVIVVSTLRPLPEGKIDQAASLVLIKKGTGYVYKVKWNSPVDLYGFKRDLLEAIKYSTIKPYQ